MLIKKETCCLHIIDPQEKLMDHIDESQNVLNVLKMLLEVAKVLNIPIIANTQYKKGLGGFPGELNAKMVDVEVIDKVEFNCLANNETSEYYEKFLPNIETAIIAGVETHICVYQTACGLLQKGITPWVVSDGVSSRRISDHETGLRRLEAVGCRIGSAEMIIYMLLERAGTESFKSILPFITNR